MVANGFALERVVNGNDPLENPAGIIARTATSTTTPTRPTAHADRARPEHLPGHQAQPGRPDRRLRLRPSLPDPGPRERRRTRPTHARQPRRRRAEPPHHAARHAGAGRHDRPAPASTATRTTRSAAICCSRARPAIRRRRRSGPEAELDRHDPAAARAARRLDGQAPATRASSSTSSATSISSRTAAAGTSPTTARDEGQAAELVRLPLRADRRRRPRAGQAAGAAGLGRRHADRRSTTERPTRPPRATTRSASRSAACTAARRCRRSG